LASWPGAPLLLSPETSPWLRVTLFVGPV
jgi:hypothetical protein